MRLLLHGCLFMKDWNTVWFATAGVAATQRPDSKRQARLPVFALTAKSTPELFVKYRRPYPIEGGNSSRLRAPKVQMRRKGGR